MAYIPVALYTAAQERGVRFNQITPDGVHVQRVREGKRRPRGRATSTQGALYVALTDEELGCIQGRRGRAIQILHFAPPRGIPPVYFDKPYPCAPDGGGKTYGLLRCAMAEGHAVGIGQCVPWNRQGMLALIPEGTGIRVQALFCQQLRTLPLAMQPAQAAGAEMQMGRQPVQAMALPAGKLPRRIRGKAARRHPAQGRRTGDHGGGRAGAQCGRPHGGIAKKPGNAGRAEGPALAGAV